MKILIVGNNFNAKLMARYVKLSYSDDIYITDWEKCEDETYTSVDIQVNDVNGICDFVKYNQIDLTLVFSSLSIINGIADLFEKEGFPIVAPYSEAARVTFFNSIAKKVMYKLKINTPRFGIFDRENIAIDYLRRAKFPLVVMNDFTLNTRDYKVYKTFNKALIALKEIFESENEKIIIESEIDSKPLYIYFLTDGYNALPLITLERNEFNEFTQIIAPSKKVTIKTINTILKTAIFPFLDDITKYAGCYCGILGIKFKILNNSVYILEYYNNFENYDLQVFLSLLDDNIVDLLQSAGNKNLNDYSYIELSSAYSYTLAVKKNAFADNFEIRGDDDVFVSEDEKNIILTKTASTLNFAKSEMNNLLETNLKAECSKNIIDLTKEVLRI